MPAEKAARRWVGTAIAILACMVAISTAEDVLEHGGAHVLAHAMHALIAGILCVALWDGKNWARWIIAVLVGASVSIMTVALLPMPFANAPPLPPSVVVEGVAKNIVYSAMLLMLFGPGSVRRHFTGGHQADESPGR